MMKTRNPASPETGLATYYGRSRKKKWTILLLAVVLLLLTIVAINWGASSVDLRTVLLVLRDKLTGSELTTTVQRSIVLDIRLPRIFSAILAGAALSLAGLMMQGIFRNPLVSPYTLGVSNGASFGACVAIIFSAKLAFLGLGTYLIPAFAFFSSMLTMALVYGISKITNNSTKTLVLTGVAVGYLFSALVSALKYIADMKTLPELVFWSMGSLKGLKWNVVCILLIAVSVSFFAAILKSWDLNAMALGQEEALALGVNYQGVQILTFILCTILTATAVSFTGVIGFVGLVAPHVTRMLIGGDHRYSIPASALMGSVLLLLSDTLARNVFAPTELPVGIVTSLIGVPFYLYLIIRRRKI